MKSIQVAMAGLLASGVASGGELWLKAGRVDTGSAEARGEEKALRAKVSRKARGGAGERGAYVVQFAGPVEGGWREWLEGSTEVRGYLPDHAYLVWATAGEMERIAARDGVAWVGEWKREWKKAGKTAGRRVDSKGQEAEAGVWIVESLLEGEAGAADLAGRLAALGGTVEEAFARFRGCAAAARLTEAQAEAAQGWPDVEWMEPKGEAAACNDLAAGEGMLDVEAVRDTMGLTGAGQVVAVADTGLDTGSTNGVHPDFAGRVTGYGWSNGAYRTYASWKDAGGHGTHVAGSIAGNGAASGGRYRGMAPEARLAVQGMWTNFNGLPADLCALLRQAAREGARLHNDSWTYTTLAKGSYPSGSALLDGYMWTNQSFLVVAAAGNEGVDADGDGVVDAGSVQAPGTAKNCLCVGAAEGGRTSGGYAEKTWGGKWPGDYPAEPLKGDAISGTVPQGLAAFSGRGPTLDGRFKPDVVAAGTDIVSARSRGTDKTGWGVAGNTNYMYYGGTSMATPLVTGSLALLRQWLEEVRGVADPPAALLKALVANGARDLSPGQYGEGAAREIAGCPDYGQGFGHVDLRGAVEAGEGRFLRWETGVLAATGDETGMDIAVGKAMRGRHKATLAWQDAPGKASASRTPVNDLDLTVTTPDGRVLHPNGLGESDRANNIESLEFAADMAGVYRVGVKAHQIAVAAPNGGQPYALVLRGPETDEPEPAAARFSTGTVEESAGPEEAMEGMAFTAADYVVAGGIPAHGYALAAGPEGLAEDEDYIFDAERGELLVYAGEPGTYRFEVAATNRAGTNTIAWVLTVAEGLPEAPPAVWVQEAGARELLVRWGAVEGATGYRLDAAKGRGFAKATEWACADEPVEGTERRMEGLSPATEYVIRVRAVNGAGAGPRSEAVCAATAGMVDEGEYEAWLAGKGLAAEEHPQGAAGANGEENWVNYGWDIAPTDTNALLVTGVRVVDGEVRLEVPAASPERHYWLEIRQGLTEGETREVYLGKGTNGVMTDTNLPRGGFGWLRVETGEGRE